MIVWGGQGGNGPLQFLNTGGRYCAQYSPPLTIVQPNGGEVWLMGSVQEIKWDSNNMKHSDHLILQYSRDGGASWFRIAQDIPAFTFGYWWTSRQLPYHSGQGEDLVARRSVDHRPERRELHCAAHTVNHAPRTRTAENRGRSRHTLRPRTRSPLPTPPPGFVTHETL